MFSANLQNIKIEALKHTKIRSNNFKRTGVSVMLALR